MSEGSADSQTYILRWHPTGRVDGVDVEGEQ